MDWSEAGEWAGAVVVIAVLLLFPKWLSFRRRAIAGAILFPIGWLGILGGLALGDRPFMQSEAVAFTWMGISALAIVLAIILLVPLFFEWLMRRRKPRRTTERWPLETGQAERLLPTHCGMELRRHFEADERTFLRRQD